MKKLYYGVTMAFYDNGRVTAAITMTREAEVKPKTDMTRTSDRDIYTDWYDNMDDAERAVAEARAENVPRK